MSSSPGPAARGRLAGEPVGPSVRAASPPLPRHSRQPRLTDVDRDTRAGLIFSALADPTRRRLVRMLVERPTVTASALADELPITRQAITKHLGGLAEAGLVASTRAGRETQYALTPEPLADAMAWMVSAGAKWDERLDRLERELGSRAS